MPFRAATSAMDDKHKWAFPRERLRLTVPFA